jgi:hypothetical protein
MLTTLTALLIGFSPISKSENITPKSPLNLEEINIIQMLSKQEFECRPSSKLTFYVETALVKKYRGYSTINASICAINRFSGQSNVLANETIIVPTHIDAIIHHTNKLSDCKEITLKHGDKVVGGETSSKYCFNELMENEAIYNSYMRSTNQLLKINRVF